MSNVFRTTPTPREQERFWVLARAEAHALVLMQRLLDLEERVGPLAEIKESAWEVCKAAMERLREFEGRHIGMSFKLFRPEDIEAAFSDDTVVPLVWPPDYDWPDEL